VDEEGAPLFEVVRQAKSKKFYQRRPNSRGGWVNDLKGVRRVLYRLPEVLAAVQEGQRVYVVEGEKDAENVAGLGLAATTNSGGPGQWRKEHSATLTGAVVAILPDNDEEGREHAQKVAQDLQGVAAEVRLVELPELAEGEDVSDWISAQQGAGKSPDEIRASLEGLVAEAPLSDGEPWEGQKESGITPKRDAESKQAAILVGLAKEGEVELFHTPDLEAFAVIPVGGHQEIWRIRARTFKYWLQERYFALTGEAPSSQALTAAWNTLTARAMFEGEEHEVHLRVAELDGAIYLDLCNEAWEAVEITASGWKVVSDPPVRFYRSQGMRSLPHPVQGGSIAELRPLVNLPDQDSFALFVAFLVAALRPRGPYVLLAVSGEQGSTKSTLTRMVRALVDPSGAPLRTIPSSERDLMISASHSWILAYDNLSRLRNWLSDALCRLATGGGFSTRELYTDSDEIIFSAMRPVILNGIDDIVGRQDLVDRAVFLHLPTIRDEDRRREDELWAEFEALRPRLLGALLDAVSGALRRQDEVQLDRPPRMADFAHWVVAAEPSLPWPEGTFLAAYETNRTGAVVTTLDDDRVANAVRETVARFGEFEDTPSNVYAFLSCVADEATPGRKDWPKSPSALSSHLNRLAPSLRRIGIDVAFSRDMTRRQIRLAPTKETEDRHARHGRHQARESKGRHDAKGSAMTDHDGTASPGEGPEVEGDDAHDGNDAKIPVQSKVPVLDLEDLLL
jgi:5S rRNA maturation endonuclease (ribonuclease M5)